MSYTPGPWTIEEHGKGYALYSGRDSEYHGLNLCSIQEVDHNWSNNKSLIETAPDLLETLEDRLSQTKCGCGHPHCKRCQMDAESQAAIDKAYGNK